MPINPNIALGVRPAQFESPINTMSQIAQLRAAQQQESFNAMRLAEAQRQEQEQASYNALMERGGATPMELIRTAPGRAAFKSIGEAYQLQQAGEKERRQAEASRFELGIKQKAAIVDALRPLAALPPDQLTREVIATQLAPLSQVGVPQQLIDQSIAQISDNPMENKRNIDIALRVGMSAQQQAELSTPKPQAILIGGKQVYVDMNPNSPTFRQPMMITPEPPFTLAPGNIRMQGGEPVAQAPFAPRQEQPAPAPSLTTVQDPTNPTQRLVVDAKTYVPGTGLGARGVVGVEKAEEVVLPTKEKQKREAIYPQATKAISTLEATNKKLITDLQELRNHTGLEGITGFIYGRTPNVTGSAREAQALLDTIKARGSFALLQAMRDASKTGGALGNVSNFEIQRLEQAFGALSQTQDKESVQKAIDSIVTEIEGIATRAREAYDTTYEYRGQAAPTRGKAPAGGEYPAPRSKAEYDALPSGTMFTDPNGQLRTKP